MLLKPYTTTHVYDELLSHPHLGQLMLTIIWLIGDTILNTSCKQVNFASLAVTKRYAHLSNIKQHGTEEVGPPV